MKFIFTLLIASILLACDTSYSSPEYQAKKAGEYFCSCMNRRVKLQKPRYAIIYCEARVIMKYEPALSHYVEMRFEAKSLSATEKGRADLFWKKFRDYSKRNCAEMLKVSYW